MNLTEPFQSIDSIFVTIRILFTLLLATQPMPKIGFKQSRQSPEYYFQWRKNRAVPAVNRMQKIQPLKNKRVLDIGCGFGALSSVLAEKGAIVDATEIDQEKILRARKFLKQYKKVTLTAVKNEMLPFPDSVFDAIIMFDVIEHVQRPEKIIKEVKRVLKNKGILYVEFTPYYSITGHHLYDYAKWPIHILPKEHIKQIVFGRKIPGFISQTDFWNQFLSLNKLRIGTFQKMVADFQKREERFIIKYPELFELNIPIIDHLGPLKDYFCMSFEGFYQKKV